MRMDTTRIWTYDDLARLPDNGKRYEILDGDLVVSPSPSREHQRALKWLFLVFQRQLERANVAEVFLAPFDAILSAQRVLVPDLMVVRLERISIVRERGIEGAPDLVLEVMSSRASLDRVRKFDLYAKAGIPEYWIVDPIGETIEVYFLVEGDYQLAGYYGHDEIALSVVFQADVPLLEIFR
jgi:Uma2 family endonuclease